MEFVFECWRCGEDCIVYGRPAGFFRELYRVDDEWSCWCCGAINITHEPPWTPAA